MIILFSKPLLMSHTVKRVRAYNTQTRILYRSMHVAVLLAAAETASIFDQMGIIIILCLKVGCARGNGKHYIRHSNNHINYCRQSLSTRVLYLCVYQLRIPIYCTVYLV